MRNRFNLNESEKNKIRSLHGIKLINEQPSTDADGILSLDPSMTIQDNLANLTKQDKVGMVTCAEQNYNIPGLVINMAGTIADNMLRSDAMEGKDESEMYGFWMAAFMNNLLIDKRTDPQLVEDIKNSTGCMYDILKKHDMLDIAMNESINEDAGMDTPGGNPDYFYGDGSLDKLRKFAEEQDSEMSKEDIINELIGIYSYSQDGATDLVNTALESLITNLGGFKDDINEQEDEGDSETEEESVKLGRIIKDIINSYKREGIITDKDTEEEFYYMLRDMRAYGQTSDFFNMKRWDARYNKNKFPKAYNLLPPLEAFKLLCKHSK